MTCLCTRTPRSRLGEFRNKEGKLVFAFHMDCPDHGIVVDPVTRPMERVVRKAWLTINECLAVRGRHDVQGIRVMEKAKDLKSALIEWIEWATLPEEKEVESVNVS